jgi:hypothetical protein
MLFMCNCVDFFFAFLLVVLEFELRALCFRGR